MDVLLRNQRIQKRFRLSRRENRSRPSVADFRSLRAIPVRKKARPNSLAHTLFFSARPLLINMIGFLLLVAVFLLLSGNPAKAETGRTATGLSATLSTPVDAAAAEGADTMSAQTER